MRTRTFSLLTLLLVLLATSCMPDSFTKFKEDPPTKTSASGGQSGDVTDPADVVEEEEDDLVYAIDEVFLLQSEGDIYFFGVLDGTGYSVGDQIYVSDEIAGTGGTLAGTITHVGVNEGDQTGASNSRVIGVRLGSSIKTSSGADADKDDSANGTYDSDTIASADDNTLATGYFIDNCLTGYGNCAAGESSVTQIDSPIFLYVPSSTPLAGQKNLDKRIYIKQGDTIADITGLDFDYTLSPDPIGIGFETAATPYGVRIVSPEGPFLAQDETGINEIPYQLTVSLKVDGTINKELDAQETATYNLYMTSAVPVPVDESEATRDFELTYYLENSDEFAVVVDSVAGFAVADEVRACASINNDSCDSDNETPAILGKARIRHIESASNTLYLTAMNFDHDSNVGTTDRKSIFKNGLFIHNSSGEVAVQTEPTYRMFKNGDGTKTLIPDFNVQNDDSDNPNGFTNATPTGVTFSTGVLPSGVTFSASSGQITIDTDAITGPSINNVFTVTARSAFTGEFLDNFEIDLSVFGTYQDLTHNDGTSTTTLAAVIGGKDESGLTPVANVSSSNLEGENIDFSGIRFETEDGAGNPINLPDGVTINGDGVIVFEPTVFFVAGQGTNGQGPYTIKAYHDAYDRDNEFGSVVVNFKSASEIENIYFPQRADQRLIIQVSDTTPFFEGTSVNLSNPDGGQGIVETIDEANSLLYVKINTGTDLTGKQVFKIGDKLDTTSVYVVERATIEDVTHVFTTVDTKLTQGSSEATPELYNSNGDSVTIGGTETFTWSISPALPSDLRFNLAAGSGAAGTGAIDSASGTAPSASNPFSPADAKVYTIVAESEVDEVITTEYKFAITGTPGNASVGRYQFVRLSGNGNRFFRGSTISTADGLKGRVLMPISIDSNTSYEGILTEFNGDIADNIGIDNVGVFAAAEATAVPYVFIDVKPGTTLPATNDELRAADGDTVEVVSTSGDRIYAKVTSGTISNGDILSNLTNTAIGPYSVLSVEDRHYINGIIEVNADPTTIEVGGTISGSNGASAIVVQKAYRDANNDGTVDKWYLLVQHLGAIGTNFREGDTLGPGAATTGFTIVSIVGPNINVTIQGEVAATPVNISSSGKGSGSTGVFPFWEGNLIVGWIEGNGGHTSTGFSVAGSTYDASGDELVVVNVEDYGSHFRSASATGYIDDFSEYTSLMDPQNLGTPANAHNKITGIALNNLIIGYVDEPIQIEPTVTGGFASATLKPAGLPNGLSFDTVTGRITGTPSEPANLTNYTITFNPASGSGSVSYEFPLVVYNHFTISADTENASSYVMHREGQGLGTSRCRVFGPQINDDITDSALYNQAIYGTNDIICLLEGAENDLFVQGIDWGIVSGAGMCEYVRYVPYSYSEYATGSTDAEFIVYEDFDSSQCANPTPGDGAYEYSISGSNTASIITATALENSGVPLTAPARTFAQTYCQSGTTCTTNAISAPGCLYNYENIDGPNLDEGSYTTRTVRCTFTDGTDAGDGSGAATPVLDGDFDDPEDTPARCDCTVSSPETVLCGGDSTLAIQGPVRDAFPSLEARGAIYSSFNGIKESQKVNSGNSFNPSKPNTYMANYIDFNNYVGGTPANSCFSGTFNFENYSSPGNITLGRSAWSGRTLNGSGFGPTTNKFYRFECLDAGNNIKARIRVLVRDWDREFTPESSYLEYIGRGLTSVTTTNTSTSITTTDPRPPLGATVIIDPTGVNLTRTVTASGSGPGTFTVNAAMTASATVTMETRIPMDDATSSCFGESCNSVDDLDNILSGLGNFGYGGACSSGTYIPAVADTTLRVSYTEGTSVLNRTAGTIPNAGALITVDPGTLAIPATVISVSGNAITIDKVMPSAGTNVQVDILSTVPTF